MFYPELEQVRKLSEEFNIIPVSMEVYADMETPISIFKRIEESRYCFLLESVEGGEKWGRYSFIGRNPFLTVKASENISNIEYRDGRSSSIEGNPVYTIRSLMSEYKGATVEGLPRFNGGAVGFFGYDTARYFEELPDIPKDDVGLPEIHFMFADEIIAFDHFRQKIHIIVNVHTGGSIERAYNSALDRIKEIYREITGSRWKLASSNNIQDGRQGKQTDLNEPLKITSNITKEVYCSNVEKAKEYIRNGDIFQVVLSQRLCAETDSDPLNVYRALRIINPGPYMYFLKFDKYTIAGSSPEMLVRVDGRTVETCPIAGTRKRGGSPEEDDRLEKELMADEKERAEHVMLVDLGRNDIGKISDFGSVEVLDFMHVEKFSHVMHIVTNVKGRLKEGKTAFDALSAVLPAGTLSGAPKIRAMEIIDELENVKRCQYGGAVGYLSFNGNLDSCITIRTIVFKDGKAYIQAGGGIVADSVPEDEFEESMNKAGATLKALQEARFVV
ncbi:MAG: anthranilate synthase component I [Clostridiales bacterium]|nr:anthranilate synthase component I [Clostridiales bacterium]